MNPYFSQAQKREGIFAAAPVTPAGKAAQPQPAVAQKYLEEQLYTMSPIQLLVKLYDIAIDACNRQDRAKASKAIVELISALNFEYEEIANRFYRLYEFCMSRAKAGDFQEAKEILQELRDAWIEAAKMNSPSTAPAAPAPAALEPTLVAQV